MKAFLDTSVLVSAFYVDHQHHELSFELFVAQNRQTGSIAGHSLAEVYSVLTGMPGKHRVSTDQALLFLSNIQERFAIIVLEPEQYFEALQNCSSANVVGGGVYDALLIKTATKARAETIYTWNVRHFGRFGPEIAGRVRTP